MSVKIYIDGKGNPELCECEDDPEYKKQYYFNAFVENLNKIKKFVKAEDVPKLPIVDRIEWDDVYVPLLIEKGALPKDQLEDGKWYYGNFRNSNFGKWIREEAQFGHWRMKFGWMWDTCDHFQNDRGFALFVPIREATEDEIKEQEQIGKELHLTGRKVVEARLLKEKEEKNKQQ